MRTVFFTRNRSVDQCRSLGPRLAVVKTLHILRQEITEGRFSSIAACREGLFMADSSLDEIGSSRSLLAVS